MKFSTTVRDPQGDLWADPAFVDAYLDALGALGSDADDLPADAGEVDDDAAWSDDHAAWSDDDSVWSARDPLDGSVWSARDPLDDVAQTVRRGRALSAQQDALFRVVLADAASNPDPWVGPDPTLDPSWQDPRDRSVATVRARRRDMAVRSAAADIAVRVHLSDHQVRARAHRADTLIARCPKVWHAYLGGDLSEQNAATVSQLADSLPARAKDAWSAFDQAVVEPAGRMAPGRFRLRAGTIRERVHPESIDERHLRAATERAVHISPEYDGMARIDAYLPAALARAIDRRLDEQARPLAAAADETRTLAQLRADVFGDLLTADSGEGGGITAIVNLTIPVMTLLGASDEPASLDGYGPIDLDTARRLAGGASHWIRVLTHPVSGTILDVDRRQYRVPKALRRWLGVHYPTCAFPGCNRPEYLCDMDHRKRWAHGGSTAAENLAPLCAGHHPRQRRDPVEARSRLREEHADVDESDRLHRGCRPTAVLSTRFDRARFRPTAVPTHRGADPLRTRRGYRWLKMR